MTAGLDALCMAAGVQWRYRDGAGQWREAPPESRRAALAALELPAETEAEARRSLATLEAARAGRALPQTLAVSADTPAPLAPPADWALSLEDGTQAAGGSGSALPALPVGYHRLACGGQIMHLLAAPARLPAAPRAWGVTLPLYGLWTGAAQDMGSYPQLGDAAEGLAATGAAFAGVNPVHAGFAQDPSAFGPYAPSSRKWLNVLHAAAPPVAPRSAGALIDYARDVPARRAALEAAFAASDANDPDFAAFRADEGPALEWFAIHQTLSDLHGPYWPDWPAHLRAPGAAARAEAAAHPERLRFHSWAQWTAAAQLAKAGHRARAAGMALGLYLDLAVGTHPEGAETWEDAETRLFARGVSLGAPPDPFAPNGQRWGLAPMRPDRLRATGCAALAETLRRMMRFAGLVRIDHILGFERSFWVPDGGLPGLYIAMPRDAMLAVARIEAARAGALIVGEDLGTLPEGLRAALEGAAILGCRVAMFEREGPTTFREARDYDREVLASFSTHDLPTWRGWRAGRDIDWRESLGEIDADTAARARAHRIDEVTGFDAVAGSHDGSPERMHAFLARSPARLVAVQAEDMLEQTEQANLPGTIHAHPNWRRRLSVAADAMGDDDRVRRTAAIMARAGRNEG